MGSFLQGGIPGIPEEREKFPSPLEGGVENYKETDFPTIVAWGNFPAPLEVWVGSYT